MLFERPLHANPLEIPGECRSHPRCPPAEAGCRTEAPALRKVSPGRRVACHLVPQPRRHP